MLSKELVTKDGNIIYPCFLGPDERTQLRDKYLNGREYMWCRCRVCENGERLYYRISSDLKIYPEHKGYEHAEDCIFAERNKDKLKKAYMADAETGEVTVYLKFNPENFAPSGPSVKHESNKASGEERESADKEKEEEQLLSLEYFARDINVDTFNARMSQDKPLLSEEYYASSLYARLKSVRFAGKSRTVRDYTIERDGFQFFYSKFHGVTEKVRDAENTSYYLNMITREGKKFNWWIYGNLYERVEKRFVSRYGITPDEAEAAGYNIVAAGFRYRRQKKYALKTYDCIGKLTLFIVNKNGIFARTMAEKNNLDTICNYLHFECKDTGIKFFFADDEDAAEVFFDDPLNGKSYICSDNSDVFGNARVLRKDICEDTITKGDIAGLLGRSYSAKTDNERRAGDA